jgi:CelD/BcsL family acetyltransferase involved in cellulose biosynthesis
VHPQDLSLSDIVVWRRFLEAQPALSSPFLTPEWAQAVGRQRSDAQIVIFRKGERAVGFLPVQRPNAFAARPLGGAVCDEQALIGPGDPSYHLAEAARALDVGRIDFTAALRESGLGRFLQTSEQADLACFDAGWDAYAAALKATGSSVRSIAAQSLRQLSEAHDQDVHLETFSGDAEAFDLLIDWKRAALDRAEAPDPYSREWVRRLVRETFLAPRAVTFGGALFVLRVKQRPVSALYCLTSRKALHAWVSASDPAFETSAVETLVRVGAVRAAARAGFTEMRFGPGAGNAGELVNGQRACGAAFLARPGVAGAVRSAEYGLRALAEALPVGGARAWLVNVMRRMDTVAGLDAGEAARPDRAA